MTRCGTTSRPRVADIVAAAGLSNDAFYRYFPSKDALVAALLEDGTERLHGYLGHQMDKEGDPEGKVRRWVEGVLSQADDGIAETTLAVLFNAGGVADGRASGRHPASGTLATLLHEPLTWRVLLGGAATIAGVAVIVLRRPRLADPEATSKTV